MKSFLHVFDIKKNQSLQKKTAAEYISPFRISLIVTIQKKLFLLSQVY